MKNSIRLPSFLVYSLSAFAFLLLGAIGDQGEPFGLALFYALASVGANTPLIALFYSASSLLHFELTAFFLSIGQSALLILSFFIDGKLSNKQSAFYGVFPLLAVFLSLILFTAFSPFNSYPISILPFLRDPFIQKTAFSAVIFLLSAAFAVAAKALFYKVLKCRLAGHELIYLGILFTALGVGFCRFFGFNAYMGMCIYLLLLFACVTKDTSAIAFAFLLSLPAFFVFNSSPDKFFVYGVVVAFFIKSGRLAACLAVLATFFIFGYFEGIYALDSLSLTRNVLSVLIPCLLFIVCPKALIRTLENELIFYREKHLSRIAINRNRAAIGEQLFEISGVFREIQTAFLSLNDSSADENAKGYILGHIVEGTCKNCQAYPLCSKKNFKNALYKLIDVGCVKGRTNLIDIPAALADTCIKQSELLAAVNARIADYRRYMTEMENAACGRNLLANQALGISEILKSVALEQSAPLRIYTDKEKTLSLALSKSGVVCSEVMISGEMNNLSLSLIVYGETDVKKIAAVASELFGVPMIISDKLTLSKQKYCCIFRRKPVFDAAFGIATRTKEGERANGDTHSIIRIDERRFLIALSDGMGSGEYAHKVSECTVSLLESFYRAKMPSALILNTVNKLLSFNREESFACVDIAVVNLDSGEADVVKIGSPMGFILSTNSLKILEGSSLPLGILDSLHPATSAYTLHANDVLLFLSDGITQAFPSTVDLYELLKSVPISNPQQLADYLLQTAIDLYDGETKDDMTVLAVRLYKNVA